MSLTKSKLPSKGVIEVTFDATSFGLLAKKLIQHLDITVMIRINSETKARIRLKLNQVYPPGLLIGEDIALGTKTTSFTQERAAGLSDAYDVITNEVRKKAWYLFGETNDTDKTPICIVIIPDIVSSYSFMKKTETNSNPGMN